MTSSWNAVRVQNIRHCGDDELIHPAGQNKRELGPDSIQRCYVTGRGNPIMEIRRSWDRFISIMRFQMLVRRHLYNESTPWTLQVQISNTTILKLTLNTCKQVRRVMVFRTYWSFWRWWNMGLTYILRNTHWNTCCVLEVSDMCITLILAPMMCLKLVGPINLESIAWSILLKKKL